jgi:hypothetical protein
VVRSGDVDHPRAQDAAGGQVTAPRALQPPALSLPALVAELRSLAISGLPAMFDPGRGLCSFTIRRDGAVLQRAGISRRYTAITLLGLIGEDREQAAHALGGASIETVATHLVRTAGPEDSLGDLSLIAWAAQAVGHPAEAVWARINMLNPIASAVPTVELAWTLSAAAADPRILRSRLAADLATRLRESFSERGRLFPHALGTSPAPGRAHVSCFADLVYPVLALAQYGARVGDDRAIACALAGAQTMCRHQGPDGQWWWHYDYRTGEVLERYPVYAVHQDSMAPMALFAAAEAAGTTFDSAIGRGLRWLASAPELGGGSLIDRSAGVIWRKVARREPAKLSRYLQAGASRLSPHLRTPGLDLLFPPEAIDYEDRPYHLGWVLYAWPAERADAWRRRSLSVN